MVSASSAGGGLAPLITLRSQRPLPVFRIPYRVPDPSAEISSFKLAILRILTGQTNYDSSSKPLTFSEELKEKTINSWKMEMLTLELRQRDDLSSSQEPQLEDEQERDADQVSGFQLQDHHDCSLIEEGDEIVVRLRSGTTIDELELPKLGRDHRYSAPAGSLTRAGTLSEPPPYSIIQPSEPSSFSSSVGAQPNANYHQHRYQDPRQGFRVVTASNVGGGQIRRAANAASPYASNPANLGQGLNFVKQSNKGNGVKAKKRPSAAANRAANNPKISTPPATATSSTANVSTATIPPSTIAQTNTAQPPSPNPEASVSAPSKASVPTIQQTTSGTGPATSSINHNGRSASGQQASMPSTALVIGPGVQGQVGRNPASAASPIGSSGVGDLYNEDHGNSKGFVGFTSAGSDLRAKPRRKMSKQTSQEFLSTDNPVDVGAPQRKPSNPASAAADAAERRAAYARQAQQDAEDSTDKRPVRDRQASSSSRHINKVDLPAHPGLPPIQNLAPFHDSPSSSAILFDRRERDLPPMPSAAESETVPASMVNVSTPTETRPPRLSFLRKFSSATQQSGYTSSPAESPAISGLEPQMQGVRLNNASQANIDVDAAIQPQTDAEAAKEANMTRADRRYHEVQKLLNLEREKQAEAEKTRMVEIKASNERRQKERERKESEAKKRAEEQKWQMWEEVRRRQKAEPSSTPVPPGIQRLYSSGTAEAGASSAAREPQSSTSRYATPTEEPDLRTFDAAAAASASAVSPPLAPRPVAGAAGGDSFNSANEPRIELGLDRIVKLLARLGSPHRQFPVIHVAGTNGKGSTIAYLDATLRNALDIRTGTFVSPHLIERRDCCKVDGEIVAKDVWRQAQSDVLFADQGFDVTPTRKDDGKPLKSSPFELLTAQTFQAFSILPVSQRPEILLIEVGLGGRLDATNVFDDSQVLASIVCPIDRDHEAFLGTQLEGIAREKAGIVKKNGLCIIADQRLDDTTTVDQLALGPLENEAKQLGARAAGILDSVRNVCMSKNARLVKAYIPWKLLSLPPTKQDNWGSSVDFTPRLGPTLFLSQSGLNPPSTFVAHPHDPVMYSVSTTVERTRANLTGVCMTLQTLSSIARDEWAQDRWEDLRTRIMWGLRDDPEANLRVREAINSVTWAGRCSWHTLRGSHILIDGAHNQSSAEALRQYLDNCFATRALSRPNLGTAGKGKSKILDTQGQFQVTYVLAFSDGKDYEAMIRALLSDPSGLIERQNVALTSFSPPEGMPWVCSAPVNEALACVKHLSQTIDGIGEIRTFPAVNEALDWARSFADSDETASTHGSKGPIVVAGSLYLVADVYRLLAQTT